MSQRYLIKYWHYGKLKPHSHSNDLLEAFELAKELDVELKYGDYGVSVVIDTESNMWAKVGNKRTLTTPLQLTWRTMHNET